MIRPPEQIADEITLLKQNHVYFCDDETFLNEDHARRVADEIKKRGIKKRYFAWARSTTVNRCPDLFRLWREIGLDAVFLGFEAISDADLKEISKNSTVSENEKAHATLREMSIALHAGFMVNADFTREDFRKLKEYMQRMPPAQITCTVYTPSPGSPAWHEEKSQYTCHPSNLHDCMHPMTPTAIPLRDFFTEFAALNTIGTKRNPLSTNRALFPLRDIVRIILVSSGYTRALRNAWRDYANHERQ
jgi:hopanoid C-3 methylase